MTAPVSSADAGLYIHFPYCEKKCPYCDFNSHVLPHDDVAYADAIIAELEVRGDRYARGEPFATVYFGGGTPSLWAPSEVGRVLEHVAKRGPGIRAGAEITLEANPGTVHDGLFEGFRAAGVTRFSIGAQSFDDAELAALGRIHGSSDAARAVKKAKATGNLVSLDLIYGQPGQTWDDVRASLGRALALEPHHVSAYTLTIEPDTSLGRQHAAGRFTPMDDDAQAELIERVTDALGEAGYARYEISSYAPDGLEARHNTLYWVGGRYLGAGAGAHSYLPAPGLSSAYRSANPKSPAEYLERATRRTLEPGFEETIDRRQAVAERLMLGLRVKWGLDLAALEKEASMPLAERLAPALAELAADGLVAQHGTRIVPTTRGFLFADAIGRRMLQTLAP